MAHRFGRSEPRERALDYLTGLLAPLERKNAWTMSEQVGQARPDSVQRLLNHSERDEDAVRDDVRDYVVETIGARDGILICDDTGFEKKGTRSARVQRQYTGTAGRTENSQVGTFLTYASSRGRALIDRELYVPKSWTDDRERCRAAGIPDEVPFATKNEHFRWMLQHAIDAAVPFAWVTTDEAYGQVKHLRVWLEERHVAHVLATKVMDLPLGPCRDPSHLGERLWVLGPGPPFDQRSDRRRLRTQEAVKGAKVMIRTNSYL